MRFLKGLAVAAAFLVAPVAHAQQAVDLTGVWQGAFWGEQTSATAFQVTLDDGAPGGDFAGSSVEPNTFGDDTTRFLQATLRGNLRAGRFSMLKTYDGVGGVAHAVTYTGTLVSERRIVGSWSVDGASGQFEVVR